MKKDKYKFISRYGDTIRIYYHERNGIKDWQYYDGRGTINTFDTLKQAVNYMKNKFGEVTEEEITEEPPKRFYIDNWDGTVVYLKDSEEPPEQIHYP